MTPMTSNGRRDRLTVRPMIGGIGAEPRAPDAIAQDHAIGVARPFVLLREGPAERDPRAEQLEVARQSRTSLRDSPGRPSHWNSCPSRKKAATLGRASVCRERVEVCRRQRHVGEARMLREDAHERVGVGVGQRFQQHAADDAVDGGVASDRQAERQDDDGRERRLLRRDAAPPTRARARLAPATRQRCAVGRPRQIAW